MTASTSFEWLATGPAFETAFETAAEEFERGGRPRPGAMRPPAAPRRRPPPRRPWPPPRPRRPPRRYPPVAYVAGPTWAAAAPVFDTPALAPATAPSAWPEPTDFPEPLPEPYPEPFPEPSADAQPDNAADTSADTDPPNQEMSMHKLSCRCPQCGPGPGAFELMAYAPPAGEAEAAHEGEFGGIASNEFSQEASWAHEAGGPFSEAEEIALAAELLSVSSEAELEEFLGKLWKGVKKVGAAVGKAAKPFAGVLKAVAKKALPFVGGALGSLIPIPGVGTALGTALGSAVSQALEAEFEGMEPEDREFEMARRFVRMAGTAAQQLPAQPQGAQVQAALAQAARQHLPQWQAPGRSGVQSLGSSPARAAGGAGARSGGTWSRRGSILVIHGV